MGRSVNYATGATVVAYQDTSGIEECWEWSDFEENLFYDLSNNWPSFTPCNEWLEREVHAIAENDFAYVAISEYCGLTSISLVSKSQNVGFNYNNDLTGMADHWCSQIANKFFEQFSALRKVATFSNGEAVYEQVA